jgi:hypothetical protein
VFELAEQGKLLYFDYHPEKEADIVAFCAEIIKRDFGDKYNLIPPHSRWRHFDIDDHRIDRAISSWKSALQPPDNVEICKRLLDLFLVSVLLDAGAGSQWKYNEKSTGKVYNRSEGLAIASLDMFLDGFFSGMPDQPHRVDAAGLSRVTVDGTQVAMQVDAATNPMSGIEGRTSLLTGLAKALLGHPEFFGAEGRPGNLIDYISTQSIKNELTGETSFDVAVLFDALIRGLDTIWPSRTKIGNTSLGDVWPCETLSKNRGRNESTTDDLIPFHKLTQWLTYSLIEPISKVLKWKVDGMENMTGLPEYRNGGLLVDFGVLTLKEAQFSQFYPDPESKIPRLPPSHPAIIEWRAMTVIELDRILEKLNNSLDLVQPNLLTLPQVLESATWKGGREIAKQKRPETGGPPIDIESDGTVF